MKLFENFNESNAVMDAEVKRKISDYVNHNDNLDTNLNDLVRDVAHKPEYGNLDDKLVKDIMFRALISPFK